MKHCIVCGDETKRPIAATLSHFILYQQGQWAFLKGNIDVFGWRNGIMSTLYLICPALNTIRFWKYRKARLVIPDGAKVCIRREP